MEVSFSAGLFAVAVGVEIEFPGSVVLVGDRGFVDVDVEVVGARAGGWIWCWIIVLLTAYLYDGGEDGVELSEMRDWSIDCCGRRVRGHDTHGQKVESLGTTDNDFGVPLFCLRVVVACYGIEGRLAGLKNTINWLKLEVEKKQTHIICNLSELCIWYRLLDDVRSGPEWRFRVAELYRSHLA